MKANYYIGILSLLLLAAVTVNAQKTIPETTGMMMPNWLLIIIIMIMITTLHQG